MNCATAYNMGWHYGDGAPSVRLFSWPTNQPTWGSIQINHLCKMHHSL